jgi:hypothetical protein
VMCRRTTVPAILPMLTDQDMDYLSGLAPPECKGGLQALREH